MTLTLNIHNATLQDHTISTELAGERNQERKEMSGLKIQLVLLYSTFGLLLVFTHCLSLESESAFSSVSHELDHGFVTTEERVVEIFEKWREKHGKVYRHEEEKEMRLKSFKKNLNYIMERNRKNKKSDIGQHEVGLNVFADMTNEEFRQTYLPSSKLISRRTKENNPHSRMTDCDAPAFTDWRKKGVVTPVKNQRQCGSCWAFSSTGAMEGINAILTGELISISEQELVDCDTSCEGCNGGNMDYAFEFVINNDGIDTESDYPYTAKDGTCNITKEEKKAVTIDGYRDVAPEENALFCSVANQPISVAIVASSLDFQLYTGGVYDGDCSSNPNDLDHGVLIVGYGSKDDQDYWIVKNSWGTNWGMEGYVYIKRNTDLEYGVCAINAQASYPTKTSVSPSPVNPPPPTPPPPSPCPNQCGHHIAYCQSGETCCCILKIYGVCFVYGCCGYENGVCCLESTFCCPQDFPVCDIEDGVCLQNYGDSVGVAAKRRKMAEHKFPWTKCEGNYQEPQPLDFIWNRRNQFAATL